MEMVSSKVLFLLVCCAWLQVGVYSYRYGSHEQDDDNDDSYEDVSLEHQGRRPCKRSYWSNGRFKRSTNCDDDDGGAWQDDPTTKRKQKTQGNVNRNQLKIDCGPDAKCSTACLNSHIYSAGNYHCKPGGPEWFCCFEPCTPDGDFLRKHVLQDCQTSQQALDHTKQQRPANAMGVTTTVVNTVFGGRPKYKVSQSGGRKVCVMIDPVPAWQCTYANGRWGNPQPVGQNIAVVSTIQDVARPGVEFNHLDQTIRGGTG